DYWPTLLGAPDRLIRTMLDPLRRRLLRASYDFKHRQKGVHDFGGEFSLREQLAFGQNLHYNALVDTLGHAARLQSTIIAAFADFLEARGMHVQDIVDQSEAIIGEVNREIISDLRAGAVTISPSVRADSRRRAFGVTRASAQ